MLKTLAVRHSAAGQPSVRSGKRMVAKEKKKEKQTKKKNKKRAVLVMAVIGGRIEVLRTH